MSNASKVKQAQPYAKREDLVPLLKFETLSQNGFFVTIYGQKVLEFDSLAEANSYKTKLNNKISPVKTELNAKYEQQIEDILNA